MNQIAEALRARLAAEGLVAPFDTVVSQVVLAVVVLFLCVAVNYAAKRILLVAIHRITARTATKWDDVFAQQGVFRRLSHIAPAIVIYFSAPLFGASSESIHSFAIAYMGFIGLLVVGSALNAVGAIYRTFQIAQERPIRSYIQAVKIFLYLIGGIAVLATFIGESPWKLLSGIGAMTAILLLIFKDSILGLVAGIQLSGNDMVRIGDWIEMPKYGADGDVIDITLNNVKVQNWDKTITTIPTYALVADSFKNWRGMQASGGRRIKRAILIDMNSVRFCAPETIERFRKIAFIGEYLDRKLAELEQWNREHDFDMNIVVNGRRLTNLGTFRAYMFQYLRHHPKIHQDMTLLVRQLPPTERGIPIEAYAFTNDVAWANYEGIQADIFDHMIAVLPEFDLRVYQQPSGLDLTTGLDALRRA